MIALLSSPLARALAGVGLVLAVSGGLYLKGRHDGRQAVYQALAEDRVKILKDGREIDAEVLSADDDALCRLLGGCL